MAAGDIRLTLLALAILGVLAYFVQYQMGLLKAPWYLPIAATLGVVCAVVALWQARSVWRVLALVLVLLIAAGAWTLLLGMRLPAYTGPRGKRAFPAANS